MLIITAIWFLKVCLVLGLWLLGLSMVKVTVGTITEAYYDSKYKSMSRFLSQKDETQPEVK